MFGYRAYHLSLAEGIDGTWTSTSDVVGVGTTGTWEGNTQFIDFDISKQVRITKVILTLDGPIYPLGDVNHDGEVTIADVAALIDYLLVDPNAAPAEADLSGEGEINIADLTMLIDMLLMGGAK